MSASAPLNVAILGPGTVGTEVIRLLTDNSDDLAQRACAPLQISGIYARDLSKQRDAVIEPALLTDQAETLIDGADIVVELMGGIEPARALIMRAINAGASVVTANKALLAEHGPDLFEAADKAGVDIYFEAAVAGAIPLVRPVRESLAGDHISRILGIVNGTTNYVLDRMTTQGLDYDVAVKEAQDLGYAEADPTADVEGYDAAAKAAILASLAFHQRVPLADVHREGITSITAADVAAASQSGHVIKLLAIADRSEDGLAVRVHPALVPQSHPLANVSGAYNAVFVEAEAAGELMFYGQGAGGAPTASAVVGDIVSVARHRATGGRGPHESNYASSPVLPIDQVTTRVQIRMHVPDRAGVLSAIAATLAESNISIESVRQYPGGAGAGQAELVIATHRGVDGDIQRTVARLRELDAVTEVLSVVRMEGH